MQKIRINLGPRSYDIIVEGGSLPRLGSFVRECVGGKVVKAAVMTTETVAGLYLDAAVSSLAAAGFDVTRIVVPDGEEYKTLSTYEGIVTRLIEERFERNSVVIPLGGGVIGDMAGFAAATFLRGVPFVQVPTTIVAQIDSSIGGKVAVNHRLGKNMIGSFHQPRGVLIDTRLLATLDPREVAGGMGEAVKHAVIRDEAFFAFLEERLERLMAFDVPDEIMERFIAWNCRIKADVVSADERESGLRAVLNYGHTVGHALETVTGYGRFKHGEAVILGMAAAGRIAVVKNLLDESALERQNALLERVGGGYDVDGISPDDLYDAMLRDKKVVGGRIRFVLADRIGYVRVHDDVGRGEIMDGVEYMLEFARG